MRAFFIYGISFLLGFLAHGQFTGSIGASFSTRQDFTDADGGIYKIGDVGDIDGDGLDDFYVVNISNGDLTAFRNTSTSGTVSYDTQVDVITSLSNVLYGAELGDVDGDGKLDILAAGADSIIIALNTSTVGSISFGAPQGFVGLGGNVHMADFDGDGNDDVIAGGKDDDNLTYFSVLRNTSTVGNISLVSGVNFQIGSSELWSIQTSDIDGDGKLDLVAGASGDNYAAVFRNTSSGPGNIAFDTRTELAVRGQYANNTAITDLDGDGKSDILVSCGGVNVITLFRNTSTSGSLSFETGVEIQNLGYPWIIETGDLTDDGKPEIIVRRNGNPAINIFHNQSSSGTINENSFSTPFVINANDNPLSIKVSDLDNDGLNDIVLSDEGATPMISAFRNLNQSGTDTDSDGILDSQDNCPDDSNAGQEDYDRDGIGEICDCNDYIQKGAVGIYAFGDPNLDFTWTGKNAEIFNGYEVTSNRFGEDFSARLYDGTEDFDEVADTDDLDFTTEFTIQTWIRPNFQNAWEGIITKGEGAWRLQRNNGTNTVALSLTGSTVSGDYAAVTNVNDGQYHMVVATYDNSKVRLYVDGYLDAEYDVTGAVDVTTDPVQFGSNSSSSIFYRGAIDNARLYNRALNGAEVESLFIDEIGSLVYQDFNGDAVDPNPCASSVTITGAELAPDRFMENNRAYIFDREDYMLVDDQQPDPQEFTIMSWFSYENDDGVMIGYGDNTADPTQFDRQIYVGADNDLYFLVNPGSTQTIQAPGNLESNRWYHVAASLSADGMKLYLDGDLVATGPTVTSAASFDGFWRIGENFDGTIDEVQIYHDALSDTEVQNVYNSQTASGAEIQTWNLGQSQVDPIGPNDSIRVVIDANMDIHNLTPNFSLSPGARLFDKDGSEIISDETNYNFYDPQKLTVRALDGTEKDWVIDVSINFTNDIQFEKIRGTDVTETLGFNIGGTWGDVNNDGYGDLFASRWNFGNESIGNLYYGDSLGGLTIQNILPDTALGTTNFADYDNDGDLDLIATFDSRQAWETVNWKVFYTNNGDNTFTKNLLTVPADENTNYISWNSGWADYDNDGDLDVLHLQEAGPRNNKFFVNNGDGTFTENTTSIIATATGQSLDVAWVDTDNDGDMDLLVTNNSAQSTVDGVNDEYYRNNGDGSFTSITNQDISNDGVGTESQSWGDIDNDGDIDAFVGGRVGKVFMYFNNGSGDMQGFETAFTGLDDAGGSAFGDYDNDGDLDLFISGNGYNFLYQNLGDGTFSQITGTVVNEIANSFAPTWSDYDRDGDLDLYIANWTQKSYLFKNTGNTNNYLGIQLLGSTSNRYGVGARIVVKADINDADSIVSQTRQVLSTSGQRSQHDFTQHVGLGKATTVNEVVVYWPSGIVQTLRNIASNQYLTISEGRSENEIISFSVGPLEGTINSEAATVEFTVPYYLDVTAITPTITLSDSATVTPNSGVAQDFTNPVQYTVTAEDGQQKVWTVTATQGGSNRAPRNILISDSTIAEFAAPGTLVANLLTIDPNLGDEHTYEVISGSEYFEITNIDQVVTSTTIPDADDIGLLDLTLLSTDRGDSSFSKSFRIEVIKAGPSYGTPSGLGEYDLNTGGSREVSIEVTDDEGVESVEIKYRTLTETTYEQATTTVVEGSNYRYTFAPEDFGPGGLQFEYEAQDSEGNRSQSKIFQIKSISQEMNVTVRSFGNTVADYNILAFPYDDPDEDAYFSGLGSVPKDWRMFRWGGNTQSYEEYETDFRDVSAGLGYFFISRNSPDLKAGGTSVTIDDGVFTINLFSGWNLIGNPFEGTISIAEVIQHNVQRGIVSTDDFDGGLRGFNGGFTNKTELRSNEGGFIRLNRSISDFEIPTSAITNSDRQIANDKQLGQVDIDRDDWLIKLHLKSDVLGYYVGGFGMSSSASDSWDSFDQSLPPRLSEYLEIQFDGERAVDIKQTDDFKKWSFEIPNKISSGKIKMTWDQTLSAGKTVIIVDKKSAVIYDLSKHPSMTVNAGNSGSFDVYFGDRSTIYDKIDLNQLVQTNLYPNPVTNLLNVELVSPSPGPTSLAIVTVDGKMVGKYYASVSKGYNLIEWNLSERSIGPGIYHLVIERQGFRPIISKFIIR